ncbi:MAG: hypothetical protein MN733_40225, partial [Nitrososphaera sp.]|nr:hypothetical protein [Nitrososphaera sp.]
MERHLFIYSFPQFLCAIAVIGLGLFVFLKNSANPINQAFASCSLVPGIWLLAASLTYSLSKDQKDLAFLLMRISYTAVIFIPVPYLYLLTFFSPSNWIKRWVLISIVIAAFFVGTIWTTEWFIEDLYEYHFGLYPDVGWLHPFFLLWFVASLSVIHWGLFSSSQCHALDLRSRNQVKYIWFAFITFTPAAIDFVPNYGVEIYPWGFLFVLAFSITTAYAIVRHQLMDIRIIIGRGVVYSLLITCITAIYLMAVLVTERWFQGFFGYRSLVATGFVALLIAIFFNPLRNRIQVLVDRALFKATPVELAAQREQLLAEVRKGEQQKAVATLAAGLAH